MASNVPLDHKAVSNRASLMVLIMEAGKLGFENVFERLLRNQYLSFDDLIKDSTFISQLPTLHDNEKTLLFAQNEVKVNQLDICLLAVIYDAYIQKFPEKDRHPITNSVHVLRELRAKVLAHAKHVEMDDSTYHDYLGRLKNALLAMGVPNHTIEGFASGGLCSCLHTTHAKILNTVGEIHKDLQSLVNQTEAVPEAGTSSQGNLQHKSSGSRGPGEQKQETHNQLNTTCANPGPSAQREVAEKPFNIVYEIKNEEQHDLVGSIQAGSCYGPVFKDSPTINGGITINYIDARGRKRQLDEVDPENIENSWFNLEHRKKKK